MIIYKPNIEQLEKDLEKLTALTPELRSKYIAIVKHLFHEKTLSSDREFYYFDDYVTYSRDCFRKKIGFKDLTDLLTEVEEPLKALYALYKLDTIVFYTEDGFYIEAIKLEEMEEYYENNFEIIVKFRYM